MPAHAAQAQARSRGGGAPFAVTSGVLAATMPMPASGGPPPTMTAYSPPPLPLSPLATADGEPPGDISELLAACNAYVDNIVSENQRMRSKLLSCRSKLSGPTQASD